ncbi:glycosylase [Kiloniella majae]|uniref:glycosylase n=1 Tax=Kiloniella majae TaxID=1938558 RepID=UPI000A277173|nr:glycosylase [Kiloniella majae]
MNFQVHKMGVIFNPADYLETPDWMIDFAQAPNALVFNDKVRVYFCTRGKPDTDNMYVSRMAFIDLNKDNLSEIIGISSAPCLELGGLGEFDEFGTYPVSVLKDGEDIVAAYGGWTRCSSVPFNISIGIAKSRDRGRTFQKLGCGPVLSPYCSEPFVITSPKLRRFNGRYVLSYTSGVKWVVDEQGRPEIIYKLRIAFSDDLVSWDRLERNIIEDRLGREEAQACPDIFYKKGLYHMFYCYRDAFDFRNNPDNSYRIGYATSPDLMEWRRDDEKISDLDRSDVGWDSEMVAYPHCFEVNGRIYLLYGGNGNGKTGIGLAEIEGF